MEPPRPRRRELSCIERWAEAHRAELVVFIVLPISWWIWLFRTIKRKCSAPKASAHADRVRDVCAAVAANATSSDVSGAPLLMRTDRSVYESLSTRNSDKTQVNQVPLRALHAILGLDDDGVLHCEPGVTVGEATRFLLARKRMLECTLEMEDATLGGLAMAQGMTTHSHVCGLLHETVVEWELVLGDGRNVTVRRDNEHADLFDALPLSHGSIGLLVGIKIRTTPSKPWVRLTYTPVKGDIAAAFGDAMRRGRESNGAGGDGACEAPFFVEGIAFARDEAVVMTGVLADAPTAAAPANRIGYWFKPWFYKHVESVNTASRAGTLVAPLVESIPILDYLMRHDRSMCMTMGTVIPYGNHPLFRLGLGWMLPPQMSFLKASHTPETRDAAIFEQVYQDISMPLDHLDAALTKSHDLFEIYPLLVYPCALAKRGRGMVRTGGAALSDDGAARRGRCAGAADLVMRSIVAHDAGEALASLAETAQDFKARKKGSKAKDGDLLVMDFVGKVDGEAFADGSVEDYLLVLGSNSFIPGLEEQLVGVKDGETRDVTVNIPDDYSEDEHLQGKEAVFSCTIKEVKEPVAAVINDETATKFDSVKPESAAKATDVAAGVTDSVASLPRDVVQLNANLGIYGLPRELRERPNEPCAVVTKVRELEAWVRSVGGFQHTYCDSFQTEAEFKAMFDHDGGWSAARAKYGAEGKFPSVYEKTRPEVDIWERLQMEEEEEGEKALPNLNWSASTAKRDE